jgi:hypothetical protein
MGDLAGRPPVAAGTAARPAGRVRRVGVADPIAAAHRHDYADAFALRLEGHDPCSPEEWVRAGVDATPAWIKWIAGSPDGLASVRVVESGPDVVVLEASDPLMETVMGRPQRRRASAGCGRPSCAPAPLLTRASGRRRILHRRTARRVVAETRRRPRAGAQRGALVAGAEHEVERERRRRPEPGTRTPRTLA